MSTTATIAAHVGAGSLVIGSLAGILPPFAALMAIFWYAIQVYESKTVQELLHGRAVETPEHPEPPEILHDHHAKPTV